MTDQPVTPDREALIDALRLNWSALPTWELGAVVDALLPLLTEALDQAHQQGESAGIEKAAQAIEQYAPSLITDGQVVRALTRLARGADRKDEGRGVLPVAQPPLTEGQLLKIRQGDELVPYTVSNVRWDGMTVVADLSRCVTDREAAE